MTLEELNKQQELMLALSNGVDMQSEIINSLKQILETWRNDLLKEIKELRDGS